MKKKNKFKAKSINARYLNGLNFYDVDEKKFPSINLIKKYKKNGKASSIIMNAANEELVNLFLQNKIRFTDIIKFINKILSYKNHNKYYKKKLRTIKDIYECDKWARLKTHAISVQ